MTSREEFKKVLQARREEASDASLAGREARLLRGLRAVWPLQHCDKLDDVYYYHSDFPVRLSLYSDKAFNLRDFVKGIPKELKVALVARLQAEESGTLIGVAFRGPLGFWVIHNYWTLQPVTGFLRCLWPGKDGDSGLVIERLHPFCLALDRLWRPSEARNDPE